MNHGAGVILVNSEGAVLMQHRDNKPGIWYPDYWGYPAGTVDENEDFEEAAKRELLEETGYKAENLEKLTDEVYTRTDGQKVFRHIFWEEYDEKQEIKCFEGQEMKFVKVEDFKGKKFLPGQERLFKLAIKKASQK